MQHGHDVIRVVVVNDHPTMTEALSVIIGTEGDMEVMGQASTKMGAIRAMEQYDPHVAVVSVSAGKMQGLQLVRELRKHRRDVHVLVLSAYEAPSFAERALHAGALGFVSFSAPNASMVEAIRTVAAGEVYLRRHVLGHLLNRLIEPEGDEFYLDTLTDREFTVFEQMGQGATISEIARRLDVQEKTVQKYQRQIREKTGFESNAILEEYAAEWIYGHERKQDAG